MTQDEANKLVQERGVLHRAQDFWAKTFRQKYISLTIRLRRIFPKMPIPLRLVFGAWWVAERSALDYELMSSAFESAEICFVQRFLRPGMTVLDAGAHHGLYTLLAAKCVGSTGRVIAFEPSPRERKRLERHLWLNRSKNVHLESLALGSERVEADLFLVDGSEDWCNSLRPPAVKNTGYFIRVQVQRLEEILSELEVGNVDFIKMDIEGAELDALKGAGKLLRGTSRPVILAEVYDIRTAPWGYEAREIVQFLARLNYRWFKLNENGSLQTVSSDQAHYDANLAALPAERIEEILKNLGEK